MAATTTTPEVTPGGDPRLARWPAIDRFFSVSRRGSTLRREIRGGVATFFTMAYIVVLNPLILSSTTDVTGARLSTAAVATVTPLVAALMTAIMPLAGRGPSALAAALGINGVVPFQLAPQMAWGGA